MAQSFATTLHHTKLMTDALEKHAGNLPAGISRDAINKLTTLVAEVQKLNQEQEKLKAELKSKTAALDGQYKVLQKQNADLRKRVKLEYPQLQWKEFGIEDKH